MATDWRAAGLKADAHRVINVLRNPYVGPSKRRSLGRAIEWIARREPTLMLDAWAGGQSADEATAAGIPVLSVDDGRAFPDGISKARGFRAMAVAGEEGGYQTAPGTFLAHVSKCDAALLDFCSHWSREIERTVRACSHMKSLVVVLMAERLKVGKLSDGGLGIANWTIVYRALLEAHSGMRVVWTQHYRRESELHALVFALVPSNRVETCAHTGCTNPPIGSAKSKYCSGEHKRAALYHKNAEYRREYARSYRLAHLEEIQTRDREARRAATAHLHRPRKCACGKTFIPNRAVNLWCSDICRYDHDKAKWTERNRRITEKRLANRTPRACFCGAEFTPKHRERHCSVECRKAYARERTKRDSWRTARKCKHCGEIFLPVHWHQTNCQKTCRKREGQLRPALPIAA